MCYKDMRIFCTHKIFLLFFYVFKVAYVKKRRFCNVEFKNQPLNPL